MNLHLIKRSSSQRAETPPIGGWSIAGSSPMGLGQYECETICSEVRDTDSTGASWNKEVSRWIFRIAAALAILFNGPTIGAQILPQPSKASEAVQDATHLYMGLCEGQISSECRLFDQEASKVSLASLVPEQIVSHYKNNYLTGVRFAMVSKLKVESVCVWIKKNLDGPSLAEMTIPRSELVKGWNEVSFPNAIEVTGDGLYLGITYAQSNLSYVASTVLSDRDGGLMMKRDDNGWEDMSHQGLGVLSIEGIIAGDFLIRHDASLHNLKQSADSVRPDRPIYLTGIIRNDGISSFTKAKIRVSSSEPDDEIHEVVFDNPVQYRDSVKFELPFIPSQEGSGMTADVDIIEVEDYADEWLENGSARYAYTVNSSLFMKKILVEYFTGESCGNCPRVGMFLDRIIEEHPQITRVLTTEHHTFGNDFLSIPESSSYGYFFDIDGAPWLLFDRQPQSMLCPGWNDEQLLWDAIEENLNVPASVYLEVDATVDNGSGLMQVDVTGERNSLFTCDNPHITLFVVSEDVPARHQYFYDDRIGKSSYLVGDEYVHHNVVRAVNEKWGVPLSFDGDMFSYSYVFQLNEDWDLNNTKVLAFVGNYDHDNNTNCRVENIEYTSLRHAKEGSVSSVRDIMESERHEVKTVFYNLMGHRISRPDSFPYIEVIRYSDGSIETRKVF